MRKDRRRSGARVVAARAVVFWGLLWFGLIDLLVVIEQDERFHEHYLFESGWGLLYLVVVAVPLVVLAMRPGDPIACAQLVVATAAVLLGALWVSHGRSCGPDSASRSRWHYWPGSAERVRCGGVVRIRSLPCSRSWGCHQH